MRLPDTLAGGLLGPLAFVLFAQSPGPARAAEWYVQSGIAEDFGYDDNYSFNSETDDSAWLSTTTLDATVGGRNPTLDLKLGGSASFTRYFGTGRSSSDAQSLVASARRIAPRSATDIALGLVRDTTLLDPQQSGVTTQDNERRLTFSVDPSYAFQLTRLDLFTIRGGWQRRTYPGVSDNDTQVADGLSNATGEKFVDYNFWTGGLGWSRTLTRRLAIGPDLRVSYFDSARDRTTAVGATVRLDYRFTDIIDLNLSVGPSYYWSDSQDRVGSRLERDQDSGAAVVADGSASVQLTRRTRASLSLGQGVGPSGDDGTAAQVTRVGLGLVHRLTRFLDLALDGAFYRERDLGSDAGQDNDRDYLEFSPGLVWRPQRRWEASLRYRLRQDRDRSGDRDDVTSNAVFLQVGYRLPEGRYSW